MQNLEGQNPGSIPIPVDTNPVTFVRGNSTWIAGQKEVGDVIQPTLFNAGDTVLIHNLDGTSFIGVITQVGPQNIIFDQNLTTPIKPGASITKLQIVRAVIYPALPIVVIIQP